MPDPAEQQSDVDEAAQLQAAAEQAIEACGGDLHATIKGSDRRELDARARACRGLRKGVAWIHQGPAREAEAELMRGSGRQV